MKNVLRLLLLLMVFGVIGQAEALGQTPAELAMKAVKRGDLIELNMLLKRECIDVNASMPDYFLENGGITMLALAAVLGNENISLTLIENGADVNARCILRGMRPLHSIFVADRETDAFFHGNCLRVLTN